jgi:hypothetical protein
MKNGRNGIARVKPNSNPAAMQTAIWFRRQVSREGGNRPMPCSRA